MNDHPLSRPGDQARAPRPPAPGVVAPWGSDAARAAIRRTCHEVTLRCQRVLAQHRPGQDKPRQLTVGDPDPGPRHGYRTCGLEWDDEISSDFVLHWRCTRARGHHGQHLAGTGERVAAAHSHSAQLHRARRRNTSAPNCRLPRGLFLA